jgi:poly(hydroxyalkanoate) depolymerase family esterase
MDDQLQRRMLEATRLTRAGRLVEATAFLQRLLRGEPAPVPPGSAAPEPAEPGRGSASAVIDVVPTHVELGDARLIERRTDARTASASPPRAGARPAARADTPAPLRGFLGRFGGIALDQIRGRPPRPAPRESDLVAAGGEFVAKAYTGDAGTRAYKLYVPSGYRGRPVPLIVMLHGCTQSPDDFAAGTRMNLLAEQHTFLVAYPAQARSANASKCWNWFNPTDQQRGSGEPSLIAGITREVMSDHAIDPRRVYVAGLSAGGAAAAIMGVTYPDLYAAIGVHSGLACGAARDLPSAFAAMRQGDARSASGLANGTRMVPTIVFHGDADATVHPRNAEGVLRQFEAAAAAELETRTERGEVTGGHGYSRTLHSDSRGRPMLEQWVVHGAGHAWSGGSPAGSYTDPSGPDAAQEMLRFFFEHEHPGDRE